MIDVIAVQQRIEDALSLTSSNQREIQTRDNFFLSVSNEKQNGGEMRLLFPQAIAHRTRVLRIYESFERVHDVGCILE